MLLLACSIRSVSRSSFPLATPHSVIAQNAPHFPLAAAYLLMLLLTCPSCSSFSSILRFVRQLLTLSCCSSLNQGTPGFPIHSLPFSKLLLTCSSRSYLTQVHLFSQLLLACSCYFLLYQLLLICTYLAATASHFSTATTAPLVHFTSTVAHFIHTRLLCATCSVNLASSPGFRGTRWWSACCSGPDARPPPRCARRRR